MPISYDPAVLAAWLAERCSQSPTTRCSTRRLHADWEDWCRGNGRDFRNRAWFVRTMVAAGFERYQDSYSNGHRGISLRAPGSPVPTMANGGDQMSRLLAMRE